MSSFREYSLKTKRVKVSPAPAAVDNKSHIPQPTPSPPAINSVFTSLRPILVLQALLGVGRLPVAGNTAIFQKVYAVALSLALLYVTFAYEPQRSALTTPSTIRHQYISTWFDFIECVVYIMTATFAYRAQIVSMLHKLDRIDRALFVEGEADATSADDMRSLFTVTSVLFFNTVLAGMVYWIAGDIIPFAVSIICRVVRDCEVSYFVLAVTAINVRLRALNRLVQPHLDADIGETAEGEEQERRRWWRPLDRLVARPRLCGHLTAEQQWQVYTDIVDCGVNLNETVSAQILACGVSSFSYILLFVHLSLIKKEDDAPLESYISSPYAVAYVVIVVLRYVINQMRACAEAEQSNIISRQTNLHVHRTLCDTDLEADQRRSMESLALLTSRRPLRYTVYRIFCIDLSLPLSFFYLCVTYIIVLVQFAKL